MYLKVMYSKDVRANAPLGLDGYLPSTKMSGLKPLVTSAQSYNLRFDYFPEFIMTMMKIYWVRNPDF
jgi:hypothetical protein